MVEILCGDPPIAIIAAAMDPVRKRKIRLVVALSAAVLLAAGLVYTSFSASTEAREPSEVIGSGSGETYDLTGKVVPGTIERTDEKLDFRISDRDGSDALPVTYTGTVPDPFRDGREVIVTGKLEGGTFVAEHDSLITKCPSKFQDEAEADPEHVIIE
jgi:cytochrome c-type biogenesis protein CcmE